MVVNVFVYVPQILIRERFDGAVNAILLAVPIGMLIMFIFIKSLRRYPARSLQEILDSLLPGWLSRPLAFLFASMYMMAGCITMLSIGDTSVRYISPEAPLLLAVFMFLIVVCMAAAHRSRQILFLIEMILILDVPLILFIIVKAFWNRSINWDSVAVVGMSYTHLPSWTAISGATYIFSGYTNLVVFNKAFPKPISPRWIWLFGPVGLGVLISSFAVPIGFQGADGVSDYIYPWITTSDSMRVELGFIERVLPLFLLLYAGISMGSTIVHWHVALYLVKEALPSSWSLKPAATWTIFGTFAAFTLIFAFLFNEQNISELGSGWIRLRFPCEIFLVLLVLIAALRRRRTV